MKKLIYFAEFIIVIFFFSLFKIIGVKYSSIIGGLIGKYLGFLFREKKIALKNLKIAFPEKNDLEIKSILEKTYINIGKIFGEYVHIKKFTINNINPSITFNDFQKIEKFKNLKKPILFFSGHFSNFELMAKGIYDLGFNISAIYRPLNNFFLDPIMMYIRRNYICPNQIKKGGEGTKELLKKIKNNNPVAIMVDQRLSSGIKVPFFSQEAFTTDTPAQLAVKFDAKLIPVYLKRINELNYQLFFEDPLELKNLDKSRIFEITLLINKKIEEFVKRCPSDWIWTHNRWKT